MEMLKSVTPENNDKDDDVHNHGRHNSTRSTRVVNKQLDSSESDDESENEESQTLVRNQTTARPQTKEARKSRGKISVPVSDSFLEDRVSVVRMIISFYLCLYSNKL
jgi:predicted DNA binding CopG/RHH family protein